MPTKAVTLDPGESQEVTFTYTPEVAKTYDVAVNGLAGSFEAIPLPEFLRCYLFDATTEMPLAGVSVIANGYSLPLTNARGYTKIEVPPRTYTISFSKSGYYDYSETVEVRTEMPALMIYLTPIGVPVPEVVLDWMRVRPPVISLGETVYIDCQCICNVPGTYSVDCIIDGVVLTQDYTFTPTQVWSARTFEYTPTTPGIYTITILGVSDTFEVREAVVGKLSCPFCGMRYFCVGWWPADNEGVCIARGGSWEEMNESRLVDHLVWFSHTPYLWYGTPGYTVGWISIDCPYCEQRFDHSYIYDEVWEARYPLAWQLIEHIKEVHPTEWEALQW